MADKDISAKNTKSEILEAYESMLKQTRELNKKNRQQQKELEIKEALVEKAREQSKSSGQDSVDSLRKQINGQLSDIDNRMTTQIKQLEVLDQAIEYEKQVLEEMYEIKKSAHTLDALLLAHKQEKVTFQSDMNEQKKAWQAEQEQVKNQWQREQQEHQYKTKISRQKDEDEYNTHKSKQEADLIQKKESVESDLAKRNEILTLREQEIAQMQEEINNFPALLEETIAKTEAKVTAQLNREHKFQFDLLEKERQGEQLLSRQTIASLEMKVKSQEAVVRETNEKLNGSTRQVQDIAVKAIEGAAASSRKVYLNPNTSRELETA